MGFRFRKSFKIGKGLRINFSKSGPNLTIGGRGRSINISSKGVRTTVGIPGSGLSYSKSFHKKDLEALTGGDKNDDVLRDTGKSGLPKKTKDKNKATRANRKSKAEKDY